MNTIELARHVVDNPDGCDIDDLKSFIDFVGDGDFFMMMKKSADLWPNEEVEQIEDYSHDANDPINRVNVLKMMCEYCRRSIKARELRGSGNIPKALRCENANDKLHSKLPEWARW